jgi:ADP-heptose:LPS heptosyltransferase
VLRPGRIGDYLCATPAVRALHRAVPRARLDYVALPLVRDLVERNPYVDRFVEFPGFPYIAEQFFDARRAVRWLTGIQAERYDLVVQLYGSGVYANPVALLMGGRRCAGFVRPGDAATGLDAALPLAETGAEIDRVLALIVHLGAAPAGRGYDLTLTAADRAGAATALAGLPRPVLGLHCGARDGERRLDPALFSSAARTFHGRRGGSVVILGGAEERAAGSVLDLTPALWRNLAGELPVAASAAVIGCLDALLTTDSGPAHLAYAVRAPSVTVYPASDPVRWAPPVPGPHLQIHGDAVSPGGLADALDGLLDSPGPAR